MKHGNFDYELDCEGGNPSILITWCDREFFLDMDTINTCPLWPYQPDKYIPTSELVLEWCKMARKYVTASRRTALTGNVQKAMEQIAAFQATFDFNAMLDELEKQLVKITLAKEFE